MNKVYLLFILLVASHQAVFSACETDRFGEVYCGLGDCAQDKEGNVFCSKFLHGDAVIDRYGNVVCGKGQCSSSVDFNDYYCSAIEGGGTNVNRLGTVKCYGGCEKASPLMCENEKGE